MSRSVAAGSAPGAERQEVPPGVAEARVGARRRCLVGLLILLGLLVVSCLASAVIGSKSLPLEAVAHALFTPSGSESDLIVRQLRMPRTIVGIVAGIALGIAGALMQGHTRNPIADPGVLGITQGAALAVVLSVFSLRITSFYGTVWFGFAGALLGALAVFAIGSAGRGGATPVALALAGTAVSFLFQAITSALVLFDQQSLDTYRFWKVGSIAVTDTAALVQVLPLAGLGLVFGLANAPGLNALSLGEDVARSLGHRVRLARGLGIAGIAVLVGSAVALCGPIGFVGLVVPHLARAFTGADYRWLLPFSGLLGASLVLLADVLGRIVARPSEVQVGVMLAMIGAPFFIALVRRRKLVRL